MLLSLLNFGVEKLKVHWCHAVHESAWIFFGHSDKSVIFEPVVMYFLGGGAWHMVTVQISL